MNRLLQGDVGSGKTVVALSAMLLAVENGGQAALIAPNEILAEQHALTFGKFLRHLPVRMALVSGRQSSAQKKKALEEIAAGRVDLVIGTHALIQKRVHFSRLTLAVIDEQHRFGVEHRSFLRKKGGTPDILVMTATPIPRTLALTIYGDLDVSVLEGLPPGRSPILTLQVFRRRSLPQNPTGGRRRSASLCDLSAGFRIGQARTQSRGSRSRRFSKTRRLKICASAFCTGSSQPKRKKP